MFPRQASKTLKLLSGAVPMVGLSALAAALQAGDRYIQTRQLVKVRRDFYRICEILTASGLPFASSVTAIFKLLVHF